MSRSFIVNLINAFTDSGLGGNPAGVVHPADALTPEMKQRVAAKAGVSESAFISQSQRADFKLDFFTPVKQIPHCGHATIASFSYLSQQGLIKGTQSSKETIDGIRKIFLRDDAAYMEQLAPGFLPLPQKGIQPQAVLKSMNVGPADLLPGHPPMVVNTGNSFMLIPLRDERTLKSVVPDLVAIQEISRTLGLIGYYAFTLETQIRGRDAAARMFAPFFGIEEESATGMAAGPLACYLFEKMNIRKTSLVLEQGRLMRIPSPSEILVELNVAQGGITGLLAGGRARVTAVREIEID